MAEKTSFKEAKKRLAKQSAEHRKLVDEERRREAKQIEAIWGEGVAEKYMVGRIKSFKGISLGWNFKGFFDSKESAILVCEPDNVENEGWSHDFDFVIKVELTWECFARLVGNYNPQAEDFLYSTWRQYEGERSAEHS